MAEPAKKTDTKEKEVKEPKETKETKEPKEAKEAKEPKEAKDKAPKEPKAQKKGTKAATPADPNDPNAADPQATTAIVATMGPPNVTNDDHVFAICHILSTWNDTFIHVTDLTGRETLARVTGGMKVKADRDESSPYAAMLAAVDVVNKLKELKINAVHIRLRGRGGHNNKSLGPGAQPALRALARYGLKMGRIEDVTPIPTDSTRRKCGRKGRRL